MQKKKLISYITLLFLFIGVFPTQIFAEEQELNSIVQTEPTSETNIESDNPEAVITEPTGEITNDNEIAIEESNEMNAATVLSSTEEAATEQTVPSADPSVYAEVTAVSTWMPDPALQVAVGDYLKRINGSSYISQAAVSKMTGFSVINAKGKIKSLQGLEYATAITTINVEDEPIEDLSPLQNLTKLRTLKTDSASTLSDLSPLAGLTQLKTLLIYGGNNINSLEPLRNLTNLTTFMIASGEISDLSPLENATELKSLEIITGKISDLQPLANLPILTELALTGNNISDLQPLGTIESLTTITLNRNHISDLRPLASLENLAFVTIRSQTINVDQLNLTTNNYEFANPLISVEGSIPELTASSEANGTGIYNATTAKLLWTGFSQKGNLISTWSSSLPYGTNATGYPSMFSGTITQPYVIENGINAHDSELYTGDRWNAQDNFDSAIDETGSSVDFADIVVSGTVDTTKAGEYEITYKNGSARKTITVTVKANQETIEATDSTLYTGSNWQAEDNFVSATDKDGKPVTFTASMTHDTVDTTKAGKYEITYKNGSATKTITVTVKVNQETVEAKASTLHVGDEWQAEDNFVSATDKDGNTINFTASMTHDTVDTTKAGEYAITYKNGSATKTITVTVKENQETVEAKASTLHVGDEWQAEDNFVSATDKDGNTINFTASMTHDTVDTTKAGEYAITYKNGSATKTITVTVKENQETVEAKASTIYTGDTWQAEDNFVSATDKDGKPVVFTASMTHDTVDTTKAGKYEITYKNGSATKTITVTVKANQETVEAKDSTIYTGDTWQAEDNFVSATDKDGNTVNFTASMTHDTVDTTKAGKYEITYKNGSATKTITVTVKANQETIEAKDSTLHVGDNWQAADNFVSATDKDGNAVNFTASMTHDTVDTTKAGKYEITYKNGSARKTITVTVKANQETIEAKDSTLHVGDNWQAADNFISATDSEGMAVDFSQVTVEGTVDPKTPGSYEIIYSYTDRDGNTVAKTVIVTVKEDKTNLIVTAETTINVGAKFDLSGLIELVLDQEGNSVDSSEVEISGSVNVNKVGDYLLTYTYKGITRTAIVHVTADNSSDKTDEADKTDKKENSRDSASSDKGTNHSVPSNENGTTKKLTKKANKNQLPQTGEQKNESIWVGGLLLVIFGFVWVSTRKKVKNK